MSGPQLFRRVTYLLAAVAFCFLFLPRPAAADSTTAYEVTFSGCTTSVNCSTPDVTGSYEWNTATNSVGSWSFTWLNSGVPESFSGNCTPLPAAYCTNTAAPYYSTADGNFGLLDFVDSGDGLGLQLAFSGQNGFDGTLLTSALISSANCTPSAANNQCVTDPSMVGFLNGSMLDLLSGSTTAVPIATPEPSSIVLLGLGLVGLFIVRRKRSARRFRLVQS